MSQAELAAERRRGRAVLMALREFIGVFAHDISNPLQSLTVLLELTLDEFEPLDDDDGKLRQSIEATERMRHMVRELATIARLGHRSPDETCWNAIVHQTLRVLQPRIEAQHIDVRVQLGTAGDMQSSAHDVELAFLTLVLGVVHTTVHSDFGRFELQIYQPIAAEASEVAAVIEIELFGRDHEQPSVALPISGEHIERAEDAFYGSDVRVVVRPTGSVALELLVARSESDADESC